MTDGRELTPRPTPTGLRPAIWTAAVGSATAGWVHAAAARNHEGDRLLVGMFVVTAIAQLLVGMVLALRPRRSVLMAALVVNAGAVVVWALTRTVGIAAVEVLATVEEVGTQDLGAAVFALVSVAGAATALLRPAGASRLRLGWAAVTASMALVAALPAVAAEHSHSHGHAGGADHAHGDDGHAHGDGDDHHGDGDDHHADGDDNHAHADGDDHHADGDDHHGDGEHAHVEGEDHHAAGDHGDGEHAIGHDHGGGGHEHPGDAGGDHEHPPGDGGHDHPTDPTTPGGGGGHEHPPGGGGHEHPPPSADDPITSLDDPRLTQAQWDAAVALLGSTIVGLRGFVTEADVVGAGYVSMGDGGSPGEYIHYVKWSYLSDPYVLDPTHVEAIVMKMNADGSTRVVAAMYILSIGDTMWDAPYIAGELTTWHDHGTVCLAGDVLLAPSADGGCPAGVPYQAPPMLHVWVEANSCGPFTPAVNGGVECGAPHH